MKETLDKNSVEYVSVKLFFAICDKWQLSEEEVLQLSGTPNNHALNDLKKYKDGSVNKEFLARSSHITKIYKSLHTMLNEDQANRWVKKANSKFDEKSALDLMLQEGLSGLKEVDRYLIASMWGA